MRPTLQRKHTEEEKHDSEDEHDNDDDEEEGDDNDTLYCICRRSDDGTPMICCDSCLEWFHYKCIGMTQKKAKVIKAYHCDKCTASGKGPKEQDTTKQDSVRTKNLIPKLRVDNDSRPEEPQTKRPKIEGEPKNTPQSNSSLFINSTSSPKLTVILNGTAKVKTETVSSVVNVSRSASRSSSSSDLSDGDRMSPSGIEKYIEPIELPSYLDNEDSKSNSSSSSSTTTTNHTINHTDLWNGTIKTATHRFRSRALSVSVTDKPLEDKHLPSSLLQIGRIDLANLMDYLAAQQGSTSSTRKVSLIVFEPESNDDLLEYTSAFEFLRTTSKAIVVQALDFKEAFIFPLASDVPVPSWAEPYNPDGEDRLLGAFLSYSNNNSKTPNITNNSSVTVNNGTTTENTIPAQKAAKPPKLLFKERYAASRSPTNTTDTSPTANLPTPPKMTDSSTPSSSSTATLHNGTHSFQSEQRKG